MAPHGSGPLAAIGDSRPALGHRRLATLERGAGPEHLCAHCVHLDEEELALLAAHDVPVAHCPRSNALLGCGIAPLAETARRGVRVGLGTDSPASTPSFDLFDELRTAMYLPGPASGSPARSPPGGVAARDIGARERWDSTTLSALWRPVSRPTWPRSR